MLSFLLTVASMASLDDELMIFLHHLFSGCRMPDRLHLKRALLENKDLLLYGEQCYNIPNKIYYNFIKLYFKIIIKTHTLPGHRLLCICY